MRHYTPAAKATIKRDWLPEITFIHCDKGRQALLS
jgi:hypothetical protein